MIVLTTVSVSTLTTALRPTIIVLAIIIILSVGRTPYIIPRALIVIPAITIIVVRAVYTLIISVAPTIVVPFIGTGLSELLRAVVHTLLLGVTLI